MRLLLQVLWQAWYWRVRVLSGPLFYTETMAASGRLGQALVMRQSTVAFESNFLSFVLAQFASWNLVHYFFVSLYLAVHCSGRLGVC